MIRTRTVLLLALALWVLFAPANPGFATPPAVAASATASATAVLRPPAARKDPHTTRIHGDTLVDDYYWLRNKGTPEVESYLNAELAYARAS